jgi:hypothetical protein
MTVITGIEVPAYRLNNEIKSAVQNNDPIEDSLHVIMVISNPCNFRRRILLAREFVQRMEFEKDISLYIVELTYGNEPYYITDSDNPRHLQLRGDRVLWHKENMINIAVHTLLPKDWKAVAWIDADIEFDSPTWALDALRILNGSRDIIQLFSHCVDMDPDLKAMRVFQSFGFQYNKGIKYTASGVNYFHPGYAWAITRKAYERIGGVYDLAILGSGDFILAMSLIGQAIKTVNRGETEEYQASVLAYQERVKGLRVGYAPGVIRHYYHGSKKKRGYDDRWKILIKYDYKPSHLITNEKGLLVPASDCPNHMLRDIRNYFFSRDEDE